tara:strand:- start:156 stop:365 length:210 start_codon:yes stop_codon:yes gene_type:complete
VTNNSVFIKGGFADVLIYKREFNRTKSFAIIKECNIPTIFLGVNIKLGNFNPFSNRVGTSSNKRFSLKK